MIPRVSSLCTLALLAALPLNAMGGQGADQPDYFGEGDKELVYQEEGERTKGQRITLIALAGATVLAGGVSTYFALESKSLSEEVSASGRHTNEAWNQELQSTYDDALSNRRYAIVGYSITGALALGSLVALLVTDPGTKAGYQDFESDGYIAPTQGGVMLGTGWSF